MHTPTTFQLNGNTVLTDSNAVITEGGVVKISPKEMDVLSVLYQYRGRTVSREFLLQKVWKDTLGNDSGLTQAISRLRKVLKDDPRRQEVIKTIPTIGYQLVIDAAAPGHKRNGIHPNSKLHVPSYRLSKMTVNLCLLFVALVIFLLLFDVNIRVEQY